MKPIKLNFAKFWLGFDRQNNFFTNLLRKHYEIIISDTPDYVIFSVFPGTLPEGQYTKILFIGENIRPDMDNCDWAFSLNYDEAIQDPRHMRISPVQWIDGRKLVKRNHNIKAIKEQKSKFCNFIYSNNVDFRNNFFKKLSSYRHIDAPGRCMNNMQPISGHTAEESRRVICWREDKLRFLKPYKFTIAFENHSYPGYVTEKLIDPMVSHSIPIYFGNPEIHREFNTKSFVSYHDYKNTDRLIEKIIEIDQDDALYERTLREPWYHGNTLPDNANILTIEKRFKEIFG